MKKQSFIAVLFFLMLTTISSCSVIGGIFKAGMGVGIFIVVLVIAIIIYLITRFTKNK